VPYKEMRKYTAKFLTPSVVCVQSTDTDFYALFASKDVIGFHKELDPSMNVAVSSNLLKRHPAVIHFPLELSELDRFFDFAPLLNHLFELGQKVEEKTGSKVLPDIRLTKNMKEIIYALVKYPEATTTELAKKLRLTRATVANAKNILIKNGLIQRKIIPNFKKLNCDLAVFCHSRYSIGTTMETRRQATEEIVKDCPFVVTDITGDRESVALRIFRNYTDQKDFLSRYNKLYRDNGLMDDDPDILRLLIPKTRRFTLDFAELTRRSFGIEREI
jgi:hypothetical protein